MTTIGDEPYSNSRQFELASAACNAGRYDEASDLLRQILARCPNDANANHLLGIIASMTGRYQDAIELISKSIDLEPTRFMAYCHLGDTFLFVGKLDEARFAYARSLSLKPGNQPAKKGMWVVRQALGETAHYHSMEGQDEFVHQHFFENKHNGVFLDIGAYDGVTGSNTCFFERYLGWTGVCFEPSPSQFQKLTQNRKARCVNACLADYVGEARFMDIVEGLTMMGGLVENYDPKVLDVIQKSKDQRLEFRTVPVMRLSSFLEEAGITRVDYCSIDVEGSEMKILCDLDFGKLQIEVFSIENNSGTPVIGEFMNSAGYVYVDTIGVDEIYHRSQTPRPKGSD